jgi:hypothetical protein
VSRALAFPWTEIARLRDSMDERVWNSDVSMTGSVTSAFVLDCHRRILDRHAG